MGKRDNEMKTKDVDTTTPRFKKIKTSTTTGGAGAAAAEIAAVGLLCARPPTISPAEKQVPIKKEEHEENFDDVLLEPATTQVPPPEVSKSRGPGEPSKPKSPRDIFVAVKKYELKSGDMNKSSMAEIITHLKALWYDLKPEERKQYEDESAKQKKLYAKYNANKPSVASSSSSLAAAAAAPTTALAPPPPPPPPAVPNTVHAVWQPGALICVGSITITEPDDDFGVSLERVHTTGEMAIVDIRPGSKADEQPDIVLGSVALVLTFTPGGIKWDRATQDQISQVAKTRPLTLGFGPKSDALAGQAHASGNFKLHADLISPEASAELALSYLNGLNNFEQNYDLTKTYAIRAAAAEHRLGLYVLVGYPLFSSSLLPPPRLLASLRLYLI